jgi:transposase
LQCDGYSAYPAFAKGREGIQLAGCWAHARRKFHEALEQSPRPAGWIIRQIQHLYRIESALREKKAGPRLRQAERAHQSRPILERIKKALVLFKASRRHLPQSLLGQAIDYALGQWVGLEVLLRDGRVEIDNNLVENAIRPTAIGKKNWLFIGEAGAGHRGAIIYTIIESCRRRSIDPYAYLRDLLTHLPTLKNNQISEVTPAAWAKSLKNSSKAKP